MGARAETPGGFLVDRHYLRKYGQGADHGQKEK